MEPFVDSEDATLDFEPWAEASARLLGRPPAEQEKVLEEMGIEADEYRASEARHLADLAVDLREGRLERAERYGARCAEETQKRAEERKAREAAENARAEEAVKAPPPAPLPPPDIAPPVLDTSSEDASPWLRAARGEPVKVAPPAAVAALAAAEAQPKSDSSGTTVDVSEVFRRGAALPFAPGAAPSPPSEPAPPPSKPASDGTTVDVSEVFRRGGAAPFPAAAAPPPQPVKPPPAPQPASEGSGATIDVSEVFRRGSEVPFVAGPPATAAPPPQPAKPPPPPQPAPEGSGATVDVSEVFRRGVALPFGASAPAPAPVAAPPIAAPPVAAPPVPALTVQQYASLVVELGEGPARRAETLRRYGLTEAQEPALDAEWQRRLTDPAARAAYDQAVGAYRAWLLQQRR